MASVCHCFDSYTLILRYGFVEFEDMRDADDAVYELNGKELCGERVVIEHARGPRRDGYGYGGRSKLNTSDWEQSMIVIQTWGSYTFVLTNVSYTCTDSWSKELNEFHWSCLYTCDMPCHTYC